MRQMGPVGLIVGLLYFAVPAIGAEGPQTAPSGPAAERIAAITGPIDGLPGRPEASPAVEPPKSARPRRPLVRRPLPALALLPPLIAEPAPPRPPRQTLVVTLAGDLGLGSHMAPVRAEGSSRPGAGLGLTALTARIAPLLDGDLGFANLETVVTARNDMRAEPKSFNFRSHPDGVAHLARLGLNLLGTANNHSMDFGVAGALDTVHHLDRLVADGILKAHAGVGRDRELASRPQIVEVRRARVAFSAVGIVTSGFPLHRVGLGRPGQMSYQAAEDFLEVARRLAETPSQYRILSVHQGMERQVRADATAIRKLRHEAVLGYGIDLVVAHHAHVVQGIEMVDGRMIFYGMGNFLHPGMANMAGQGLCKDYGLFARVHLASDDHGHHRVRAVEVIPLTDMHAAASPMPPAQAAERVRVLNYLAGGLDDDETGAVGMRFATQPDGRGLFCVADAGSDDGRVGAMCKNWQGPDVLTGPQRARLAGACGHIADRSILARAAAPVPRTSLRASRRLPRAVPVADAGP